MLRVRDTARRAADHLFSGKSQRGNRADFTVFDGDYFFNSRLDSASGFNFASGMIFLRLFFVLLLAIFAVKDWTFRAYSFMLVLRSLSYWGLRSHLGLFFTANLALAARLDFLAYHLLPVGHVVILMVLLPIGRMPGFVCYLLFGLVAVTLLLGVGIVADYRWYWLLASQYMVLVSHSLNFGLYLYTVLRRWPINWYYSVPFLLGESGYFCLVLGAVGIINAPWVFGVTYFFFFSEIFVFGLFLGKIIFDYRREREAARQKMALKEEQTAELEVLDALKTTFFANIPRVPHPAHFAGRAAGGPAPAAARQCPDPCHAAQHAAAADAH